MGILNCMNFIVSQIGHQREGMDYKQLTNNSLLDVNTTLICITELYNSPQVQWEYIELNGTVRAPISNTDAMGISELAITLDNLGTYSCYVAQDGGTRTVKLTVTLVNTTLGNLYVVILDSG